MITTPWPKIKFKTGSGSIHEGYVCDIVGENIYVSQNQTPETMGLSQNWVINKKQVIYNYEAVKEVLKTLPKDRNIFTLNGQVTGSSYDERSDKFWRSSSIYDGYY